MAHGATRTHRVLHVRVSTEVTLGLGAPRSSTRPSFRPTAAGGSTWRCPLLSLVSRRRLWLLPGTHVYYTSLFIRLLTFMFKHSYSFKHLLKQSRRGACAAHHSGSCRCAIVGVPWCLRRLSLFCTLLAMCLTNKSLAGSFWRVLLGPKRRWQQYAGMCLAALWQATYERHESLRHVAVSCFNIEQHVYNILQPLSQEVSAAQRAWRREPGFKRLLKIASRDCDLLLLNNDMLQNSCREWRRRRCRSNNSGNPGS